MASQMTSKIVITLITGLRPDRHAMIPVYHKMAFGMARCNGSDESGAVECGQDRWQSLHGLTGQPHC